MTGASELEGGRNGVQPIPGRCRQVQQPRRFRQPMTIRIRLHAIIYRAFGFVMGVPPEELIASNSVNAVTKNINEPSGTDCRIPNSIGTSLGGRLSVSGNRCSRAQLDHEGTNRGTRPRDAGGQSYTFLDLCQT